MKGQENGQVFGLFRNHAALLAVDHGNGGAPVALAGNIPVAQAELGFLLSLSEGFELFGDEFLGLQAGRAVVFAGIDENAGLGVGFGPFVRVVGHPVRADDLDDGEMVFAGEVEVSLVVGRDAHDRARAVGGNDEVAEPDGHAPACQGMQCVGTGENAFLLERVGLALNAVHVAHVIDEGRDGGLVRASLDEPGREWMFGGHNNEGSAEQGIRAL